MFNKSLKNQVVSLSKNEKILEVELENYKEQNCILAKQLSLLEVQGSDVPPPPPRK